MIFVSERSGRGESKVVASFEGVNEAKAFVDEVEGRKAFRSKTVEIGAVLKNRDINDFYANNGSIIF